MLPHFLELQAWSRTQTGNVIKMIRSDGEWASNQFKLIKPRSDFEHKMSTPGRELAIEQSRKRLVPHCVIGLTRPLNKRPLRRRKSIGRDFRILGQ